MIVGLGIDLLELARFRRSLATYGERLERRVFTEVERRQCGGRVDRAESLAARFAAKEACLKALGTGQAGGLALRQVEVVRTESGRPELLLHGAAARRARERGVRATHVSLTHQPGLSAAVVVLEG